MSTFQPKTLLDKIFVGGLLLKGLSAFFEATGALLLIFVPSKVAMDIIGFVTQRELFEDPNDLLANYLVHETNALWTSSHTFAILFLTTHAVIKLSIVIGLLKNFRWAYPFSAIALVAMILYQAVSLVLNFGFGMLLITLFDIFILWLIWHEYKHYQLNIEKEMD